jgi:hypothetical protein
VALKSLNRCDRTDQAKPRSHRPGEAAIAPTSEAAIEPTQRQRVALKITESWWCDLGFAGLVRSRLRSSVRWRLRRVGSIAERRRCNLELSAVRVWIGAMRVVAG